MASDRRPYGEGIKVRIVATEPDAFKPGETIDLGVDSFLSPNDIVCGETLDVWLEWRTRRIASHENRENLHRLRMAIAGWCLGATRA
jgi:hypothetical protein